MSTSSKVNTDFRLDDLYKMTAYIYHDGNMGRSKEATLLHFVEVCGMLTLLDRKKKREGLDVADALCKALGWYFPLLAKMGVDSVERLIFSKFPLACPYCRHCPHIESACKLVRGTEKVVSHAEVKRLTELNWSKRPKGLNEWQKMFADIYPRSLNSQGGFITIALFEEIGELAESIRVFDRFPHYFYGEAADVFSYIMGLANEYELQSAEKGEDFDFEREFLSRYPGLCVACGARVCVCPTLPQATVGRMAKEMPLVASPIIDVEAFDREGQEIGRRVLESAGRIAGVASKFPYDRGEMNAALTQLAFRLSAALAGEDVRTVSRLRELAINLSKGKKESGTEAGRVTADVLDLLKEGWLKVDPSAQQAIEAEQPVIAELANMLEVRILLITTNAEGRNELAIRLDREVRAIRERVQLGTHRDRIHIQHLAASTIADLRRALLASRYDIIHFGGHATNQGLEFDSQEGPVILEFEAFSQMLSGQANLKCVLLNACNAMQGIRHAFAPLIIAMVDEVDDDEAIAFATGFYDALAAGVSAEEAFDVGRTALSSENMRVDIVAKMKKKLI